MFRCAFSRTWPNLGKLLNLQNQHHFVDPNKIHNGDCVWNPRYTPKSNKLPTPAIANKFQIITEENSPIIEHTDIEILRSEEEKYKYPLLTDEFDGINLERGKTGVFDIKDLVELLRRESSKDIFVATVPKEINYVSYICIVTARSKRHIIALGEFVRKVYKKKCSKNDFIPRLEGKTSDDWIAVDLGNIALHIFSDKTRKVYDLETLWAVGHQYDEQMNTNSDITDMFENYNTYLKDLKPLA